MQRFLRFALHSLSYLLYVLISQRMVIAKPRGAKQKTDKKNLHNPDTMVIANCVSERSFPRSIQRKMQTVSDSA